MSNDKLDELMCLIGETARLRRAPLIAEMSRRSARGHTCAGCSGVCCTFVANSMQTTPLETADLLCHLHREGRLTRSLKDVLGEVVRRYRLDVDVPGDGRRQFLRRTYTCPFFSGERLGCTISRWAKPYGCLAFNATMRDVREGEGCVSDQGLLGSRESLAETRSAKAVGDMLAASWAKLPMPLALLRAIEALDQGREPDPTRSP